MSELCSIASKVVKVLKKNNLTVSFAESCTGGLLSELITSVPGASEVFELGICCYSNNIKNQVLNVPKEVLETFGAVSQETAIILAKEIKRLANSTIGISVTGVAGPSKSEGKEVGTVFVGFCNSTKTYAVNINANSNLPREKIRTAAAEYAFNLIIDYCLNI